MAHDIHTKAAAMVDLLIGDRVRDVADRYRVPDRTVRRWNTEAWALVRNSLSDAERAELPTLRAAWPVAGMAKNGRNAWGSASYCNAKTRSGERCRSWPVRSGRRCRMHGGRRTQ